MQHAKHKKPSGTSGPGIASAPSALPSSSSTGRPAPRHVLATRQAPTKVTVRSERWRILAAVKQATLEANASTLDPDEDPSIYQSGIFDDASVTSGQRFKGRIKSYNPRRGYGFIDCPDTFVQFGQDVTRTRLVICRLGRWCLSPLSSADDSESHKPAMLLLVLVLRNKRAWHRVRTINADVAMVLDVDHSPPFSPTMSV